MNSSTKKLNQSQSLRTNNKNHYFFSLLRDKIIYIIARGKRLPAKRAIIKRINIMNLQSSISTLKNTSNSTFDSLILP